MVEVCHLCRELADSEMVIYKDDYCFVIIAKWPIKEGHVMVMPIRHVGDVSDLIEKEAKSMFNMIGLLQDTYPKLYGFDAMVIQNPIAKRTQEHLHYHVLPTSAGIRDLFTSYEKTPLRRDVPRDKMAEMAGEIRRATGETI